MKYPVTVRKRETLVVAPEQFLEGATGHLDEAAGFLDFNVTPDGRAHLHWILDADGVFIELSSMGIVKPGVLQFLGLKRRVERYRLLPARRITAGELAQLVTPLIDDFPEAPQVEVLQRYLETLRPDQTMDRELMRGYLGE